MRPKFIHIKFLPFPDGNCVWHVVQTNFGFRQKANRSPHRKKNYNRSCIASVELIQLLVEKTFIKKLLLSVLFLVFVAASSTIRNIHHNTGKNILINNRFPNTLSFAI